MNDELFLFTCPKCKHQLAWANQTARVYCKACDKWVSLNQSEEESPVKLDPEQDQMLLF